MAIWLISLPFPSLPTLLISHVSSIVTKLGALDRNQGW